MSNRLRASDTISGKEGTAYAEINGNVEEMFYIKNLEATVTKAKTEIKVAGGRNTQHKTVGWAGAGSMTIYYMTPIFRRLIKQYKETGRDVYFKLVVTNNDEGSTVGRQTTVLYDVNLDSTIITKFNIDDDALEEDMDFTFGDFDFPDEFNAPTY